MEWNWWTAGAKTEVRLQKKLLGSESSIAWFSDRFCATFAKRNEVVDSKSDDGGFQPSDLREFV